MSRLACPTIETVVVLSVATAITSMANASPVRWEVTAGGNGHSYEAVFVGPFTTWASASATAQARGGYLVTLTSAEEDAFVFSLVRDRAEMWSQVGNESRLGPWIGATRPDGSLFPFSNGWSWVTGEPWEYTHWVSLDGGPRIPHFVQYFADGGGWNDLEDGVWDVRGFVMEYPPGLPCEADFNGNHELSVQDIFDFLAAYFAGDFAHANFNGDAFLSVQDIFDFLAAYFAGCA